MTAVTTAPGPATMPAPAGPRPLAVCEFCRRPVGGPLADCPDPLCQLAAIAVAALMRGTR